MFTPPTFGDWLQRQRRVRDWTRKECAQALGCSVSLITKLERDVRTPSASFLEYLWKTLEIPPEDRPKILALVQPAVAPVPLVRIPSRATSFYGRRLDRVQVATLLRAETTRCVSIIGPGGVGKTSLSQVVARELLDDFPGGVVFIALAEIHAAEHIIPALAQQIPLSPPPRVRSAAELVRHLPSAPLLLVLDNIEQLAHAQHVFAALLAAAPQVKILASSRQALGAPWELVHELQPFTVPTRPLATLPPAISLFCDRVRSLDARAELTAAQLPLVYTICQAVDGLPLGIELAASQLRLMTLEQLAQSIQSSRLRLQSQWRNLPPRQQSLAAMIAWSYDLLAPTAQQVLALLAIFRGEWSLGALRTVWVACFPDVATELEPSLAQLTAAHLLQELGSASSPAGADERIYAMLVVVQDFAAQRLAELPQAQAVRSAHARYYAQLAASAAPILFGPDTHYWVARLRRAMPNLRAALDWLYGERSAAELAQMTQQMYRFWELEGLYTEAITWYACAAQLMAQQTVEWIKLARNQAIMHAYQGEFGVAEALIKRVYAVAEQQGLTDEMYRTCTVLGWLCYKQQHGRDAALWFERAYRLAQPLIPAVSERSALLLDNLASAYVRQGRWRAALTYISKSFDANRDQPGQITDMVIRMTLARWQVCVGHSAATEALLKDVYAYFAATKNYQRMAEAMQELGLYYAYRGAYSLAITANLEALKCFSQIAYTYGVGCVQRQLGELMALLGQTDQALDHGLVSSRVFQLLGQEVALYSNQLLEALLGSVTQRTPLVLPLLRDVAAAFVPLESLLLWGELAVVLVLALQSAGQAAAAMPLLELLHSCTAAAPQMLSPYFAAQLRKLPAAAAIADWEHMDHAARCALFAQASTSAITTLDGLKA